jgi:uncharacterized protein (DUF2225 family)
VMLTKECVECPYCERSFWARVYAEIHTGIVDVIKQDEVDES